MKKIIIVITIFLITFSVIFLNLFSKKEKEIKQNKNISIILETEEGNIESNKFPSKEGYEYSKVVCENTNNAVRPTFNNDTWKLSLSVEGERVDGNFNCSIYFKEKEKTATDIIIEKATEGNSEGLIRLEQPETGQTPALTEYRYSGSNDVVKNYVNFNNETWRIIGVFPTDDGTGNIENRIKIIREERIGLYSWDTSSYSINEGYGINQWGESGSYEGADLMRLLNPGYENESINNSLYWNRGSGQCYGNGTTTCNFSSTGLTSEAKNMIENALWYTSATEVDLTTSESYEQERGNELATGDVGISVIRTINWTGKVGLMYPSDYGFASSGCRNGEQTLNNYNNATCTDTNWLYKKGRIYFMLSPGPVTSVMAVHIFYLDGKVILNPAETVYDIYPTLYLSPSVKIASGTGTIDDMYQLSL